MNESDILSEYFKDSSTSHNFFDQISYESNNFESMNNEASRRSCAWLPSDQTRNLLIQVVTKINSPVHTTDEIKLTKPKIVCTQSHLEDHLAKYIQEEDRIPQLSMKHVTLDDRGLRELIQAESYHAAIEMTEKMLSVYTNSNTSKHSLHSVQLWFTRMALLVKANLLVDAYEESKPWGNFDTPDLYLQYYPTMYGGRIGSMVPFSFRLLVAELPQYIKSSSPDTDSSLLTLDRLFSLLRVVKKILANLNANLGEDGCMLELSAQDRTESLALWRDRETRVNSALVNCALRAHNYTLACDLLSEMLRRADDELEKIKLNATLGRVLLQAGDLQSARLHLNSSSQQLESALLTAPPDKTSSLKQLKLQSDVNQALLLVSENKHQAAYDKLVTLGNTLAGNVQHEKAYILVVNNQAICLFYLGKLKQSIELLESLLKFKQCLNNRNFVANLSTMYELYSINLTENKLNLLRLINENKMYCSSACIATLKL